MNVSAVWLRIYSVALSGCFFIFIFCAGLASAFSTEGRSEDIRNILLPVKDRVSSWSLTGDLSGVRTVAHGGAEHSPRMSTEAESVGICPQERQTPQAPKALQGMTNPLEPTAKNLTAGEVLFKIDAKPTACKVCHGFGGDGLGIIFDRLQPKPRNFTCYYTMEDISDGQMYWIIKSGSPGTAMPSFGSLDDREIWQLILYVRKFTGKH